MENYEEAIQKYVNVLKSFKNIPNDKLYDICLDLYNILYVQYEYYVNNVDKFEKESALVKICITILIPIVEKYIKDISIDNELRLKYYELYENLYYFASRRSFKHFLLSMEFKWKKKVFRQRIQLFEPIIFYLNKLALDNEIKLIRISLPPRIW